MPPAVVVRGQRELIGLFARADKESRLELRKTLREVAEPIRSDAERLAAAGIPRIGPRWSRMRVGVTARLVYVAPRQRGARGRDNPRRRPAFATLMEQRAMAPALARNEAQIEARVEEAFEKIAHRWGAIN